jgi:hypothetical protein
VALRALQGGGGGGDQDSSRVLILHHTGTALWAFDEPDANERCAGALLFSIPVPIPIPTPRTPTCRRIVL